MEASPHGARLHRGAIAGVAAEAAQVLIVRLLMHFKQEGYKWHSRGMAPLAGLLESPAAPIWHGVAIAAYDDAKRSIMFEDSVP
jgi:phosphatidylglycerol lysyltransferase